MTMSGTWYHRAGAIVAVRHRYHRAGAIVVVRHLVSQGGCYSGCQAPGITGRVL